MDSRDNLIDLLKELYSQRYRIFSTTIMVGVIAFVASLFLSNFYEANTTFYAASTDVINPSEIFGPPGKTVRYFGVGDDRDRLLTIAQSNPLVDRMIDSFDLFAYYKIKPEHPKARERARLKFRGHYRVVLTKYDGIQLSMEDKDPELAASMANAARHFVNQIATEYLHQSQQHLLQVLEGSINHKQLLLSHLTDSISREQQRAGVYDQTLQRHVIGKFISEKSVELAGERARLNSYRQIGYANRDTIANVTARIAGLETQLAGLTGGIKTSELDIEQFNISGGLVSMLQQQFDNTRNQLSYEIEKANHLRAMLDGSDAMLIVPFDSAQPPMQKSRPKRMFLTVTVMIIGFLFSCFYFLVRRQFDHVVFRDV